MITTAKQLHEIAKLVAEKNYDFDCIGLRVQEFTYGIEIGQEIQHVSRHWDDGEMTDEDTDGICAVSAKVAASRTPQFGAYSGKVILVLGSNRASTGEDDGEVILKASYGQNPVVLDIIRL